MKIKGNKNSITMNLFFFYFSFHLLHLLHFPSSFRFFVSCFIFVCCIQKIATRKIMSRHPFYFLICIIFIVVPYYQQLIVADCALSTNVLCSSFIVVWGVCHQTSHCPIQWLLHIVKVKYLSSNLLTIRPLCWILFLGFFFAIILKMEIVDLAWTFFDALLKVCNLWQGTKERIL